MKEAGSRSTAAIMSRRAYGRQNRFRRAAASVGLAILLLVVSGCSISASSESLSQSISSPFASSSGSSSPEEAYREDVSDYTAAHVQSGGKVDDLRRQIGELAAKHGITDWEHNQATFQGVGEGLAKAGYRQIQVDAFKMNFAETDEQAKWLQKGYDSKQ